MREKINHFYDFEQFRIDTLKRNLLYNGQDLQIKPKAFETLLFLVERRGDVVSKSELLNNVWSDTFVEENNLTQQISTLRKKFKELAENDEFIVTIPKHGYKFVKTVSEVENNKEFTLPAESIESEFVFNVYKKENSQSRVGQNPLKTPFSLLFHTQMREITLGCILMVMVVCFSLYVEDYREIAKSSASKRSIAVLEFESLDGNAKSSLYSAGITRTLTAKIGNLETMVLRPAGLSGKFYGQERDVIAIGNQLQADIVLEGSVQNEGELVRVAVIAWDSKANRQIWGNVFTKDSSSIFNIQDEVAREIISAVQGRLRD